ncbi:MAG: FtsX-like permease family protein [Thermoleophilia bacterium]
MTWKLAFRNLTGSKLRVALTSIAIFLGVTFVVASFVLGDTINRAFDDVLSTANQNVSVRVQGVKTVSDLDRQPVPASLLPAIRAVDGVASADGTTAGSAQIIGKDGKPAGLQGPPALGFGWTDNAELNPLKVLEGRAPTGPDDVVIDKNTFDGEDFALGDRIRIITDSGSNEYTLVGVVGFGDTNNLAGATIASFAPATAARAFDSEDRFVTVDVAAAPGVSDAQLAERVQAVLPRGYEAITGQAATEQDSKQFKQIVDILRNVLLAFAVIVLFVGSFIIFNAFKITVAQRTRQVGLLRAVGASGGQVVRSVMLEAFITGLAASVAGVIAGIAGGWALREVFNAIGASIPQNSLVVQSRSLIVGLIVGLVVTLAAAFGPAWRASRVPPVAALREQEVHSSRRIRLILSVLLTVGGVGLVLLGMLGPSGGLAQRFSLIGLGAMLLFIGAAMLTQYVARPLARVIGAPMTRLGLAGKLGQGNAMRNPSRTAQTAAALTIGVALVTCGSVFAASIHETFIGTLDKRVRADVLVFTSNGQPFSPVAAERLAGSPQLSGVTAWRDGQFKDAGGDVQNVSGVDPRQLLRVYDPGVESGAIEDLASPGTVAVHEDYAKEHDLSVGSELPALFAKSGQQRMRVVAIYRDNTFSDFFTSLEEYERNFTGRQDSVLLATGDTGVSPDAAKAAARAQLTQFPNLEIYTKAEYKNFVGDQINGVLYIFYGLLALSILIAVFGIVLTLALSVFERTREIGLLRAVGLSRRNVRAMIRWEAIIVALIGAVVGLVLGVFLGVVSVSAIPEFNATVIPWGSMIVFLVVAGIFGVIAAILPARRAARLNILAAIANE